MTARDIINRNFKRTFLSSLLVLAVEGHRLELPLWGKFCGLTLRIWHFEEKNEKKKKNIRTMREK